MAASSVQASDLASEFNKQEGEMEAWGWKEKTVQVTSGPKALLGTQELGTMGWCRLKSRSHSTGLTFNKKGEKICDLA